MLKLFTTDDLASTRHSINTTKLGDVTDTRHFFSMNGNFWALKGLFLALSNQQSAVSS
jgi:hypothetical protein